MTAGVFHQPWRATLAIIVFAALAGLWAWQATTPLDDADELIDPTDARQRFTHVRGHK
jgi:hypothetical protein